MAKFVRMLLVIATALGVGGLVLLPTSPALAVQTPQDRLVSQIPVSWTPSAVDGSVQSIVQIGNTIVMGGDFTQVEAAGSTTPVSRPNILAFNATTGALSTTFLPQIDGMVEALLPSADGKSVYVGGDFHTVNGKKTKSLTELSLSDGTTVTAFKTPSNNGKVKDLRLAGGNLWVAGSFTIMGGVSQTGLTTLNPITGAPSPYMRQQVAGTWNGGTTTVAKIDVTPDGSKLVGIGNFRTVGGQPRAQVFMLDLSGSSAQLANWQTNFYTSTCSASFDSYLRDLDISPDGSYMVISTTGAYHGSTSACDETSRWETGATGSALTPTWTDYTGGDTTYAVAITDTAVYTGGHARWQNNPFKGDSPGQGAVSRPGIAALDPVNGLPFSWNPTRERGVGVFDLLATDQGLWVGSDTDQIGDFNYHGKLAFLPLAGGEVVPATTTGVLPGNVYLAGSAQPTNPNILYRVDAGGPALPSLDDGPAWAEDDAALTSTLHNTGGTATSYACCAARGASLPDSAPTGLFNSERYDPSGGNEMQWHFPVPAGQQVDVRLYFANRATSTNTPGKRTFDVTLDNTTVLSSYDVVADAGNATGVMKSFPVVSDGTVDVSFAHKINNPLISGIEIVRTDGPTPPNADTVQNVAFSGTGVLGYQTLPDTGISWHSARGATMINGKVYYGYTDGQLYSRAFDGTTFGPATPVNGMDLLTPLTDFHNDVPNITAMFFNGGRLYYTLNGDSHLYYRYFTPESNVVGASRFTASNGVTGMNFAQASGMFVAGGELYLATSDGNLQKSDFVNGAPSGTGTVLSGPGLDGTNWSSRAMFLYAAAGGSGTNQPPTARMSVDCQDLACTMTGDGSSDPEGLLASYHWDFGDGDTSTQADPNHTLRHGRHLHRVAEGDRRRWVVRHDEPDDPCGIDGSHGRLRRLQRRTGERDQSVGDGSVRGLHGQRPGPRQHGGQLHGRRDGPGRLDAGRPDHVGRNHLHGVAARRRRRGGGLERQGDLLGDRQVHCLGVRLQRDLGHDAGARPAGCGRDREPGGPHHADPAHQRQPDLGALVLGGQLLLHDHVDPSGRGDLAQHGVRHRWRPHLLGGGRQQRPRHRQPVRRSERHGRLGRSQGRDVDGASRECLGEQPAADGAALGQLPGLDLLDDRRHVQRPGGACRVVLVGLR